MNKYKKLIISAVCTMALFATTAFAADVVKASSNANVNVEETSFYNAGEFGLNIGSGYTLNRADLFKQPYSLNFNAGLVWFPIRNLGVEANVPFYQTKGVSVTEVQSGVLFRLPLAKTVPVLKSLSPYIGLGAVYDWNALESWAYVGKVGLEVRPNKNWGVFVEGQTRNSRIDWNTSQTSIAGGLRLVF